MGYWIFNEQILVVIIKQEKPSLTYLITVIWSWKYSDEFTIMFNLITLILYLMRAHNQICCQLGTLCKATDRKPRECRELKEAYLSCSLAKTFLSHQHQSKDPHPAYLGLFQEQVVDHSTATHTSTLIISTKDAQCHQKRSMKQFSNGSNITSSPLC